MLVQHARVTFSCKYGVAVRGRIADLLFFIFTLNSTALRAGKNSERWSSIQSQKSSKGTAPEEKSALPEKTPRLLRSFAQSRVVGEKQRKSQYLAPGMSQYSDDQDAGIDAGTAEHPDSLSFSTCAVNQDKVPQEFDIFSTTSGSEESMIHLE